MTIGHKYVVMTLDNVKKLLGRAAEAVALAQGDNFHVLWVKKRMYEPPQFIICVHVKADHKEPTVTCEIGDITSEARLRRKLAEAINELPVFAARGKQYEVFSNALLQMAEIEEIPQDAKTSGQLRSLIVNIIREPKRMAPGIPDDQHGANLGWYDRTNGHLDLRGGALLHLIQSTGKLAPTAESLWAEVARMGGREHQVTFPGTGMTERVWALDSKWLEPEKEEKEDGK